MIWLRVDGKFVNLDAVPEGSISGDHLPHSSLDACRALLSAEDQDCIEAAAAYPEGSVGCTTARRLYMAPNDLGFVRRT